MTDKPTEKTAATITIHGARRMSPEGRKRIADWLRQHANDLMVEGDSYADRFRGRYLFEPR